MRGVRQVVVSYSISTSNHNCCFSAVNFLLLYLIPFLHQTTTDDPRCFGLLCCILFHFYIKPQPIAHSILKSLGCILFHFYIKPQQCVRFALNVLVVSYSISTSNHNNPIFSTKFKRLYLIPFLHQTTTLTLNVKINKMLYLIPFLHQTTTYSA